MTNGIRAIRVTLPRRNSSAAVEAPGRRGGGPSGGWLTNARSTGMIRESPVEACIGRVSTAPLNAPGKQLISAPAPDTEPFVSGIVKAAAPRRASGQSPMPARRASRKELNQRDDVSNRLHIRGGPLRRDAPPPAPFDGRRPPLLQHERLHQLSRGRPRHRRRDLPHLRLSPPPSLIVRRDGSPLGLPEPGNHRASSRERHPSDMLSHAAGSARLPWRG
jgi:hypothetical protein